MAEARKAGEGEDADAIKRAVDRISTLSHRVAENLYKASGGEGGQPGGAGPSAPGEAGETGGGKPADDVVDAEYTVKE